MISISKVSFRGYEGYDQVVSLTVSTHLSFSSNNHSVTLMVNNPNAPNFQLGKAWNSQRRGEQDWMMATTESMERG